MAENLDDLLTEMEDANTVTDGLIIFTDGLKAKLDEALKLGNPAAIVAKVKAISASIETQKAETIEAIKRNTVAATEPPSAA